MSGSGPGRQGSGARLRSGEEPINASVVEQLEHHEDALKPFHLGARGPFCSIGPVFMQPSLSRSGL